MKYLLLKPSITAGIGDQILSLITAVAYARLSDRVLSVDWRGGMYGMPPDENLFERIFELNEIHYVSSIPSSNSVYPPVWNGALGKTFEQLRADNNFEWDRKAAIETYSIDATKLDYDEDVLVMWDFDQFKAMIPLLIETRLIKNCRSQTRATEQVYDRFVRFKKDPSLFIDVNWEKIKKPFLKARVVGVHVRDTKESFATYGQLKRNRYFEIVDSILDRDQSVQSIFIATDNSDVQDEFVNRYGNKVFFKEKWFAEPGSPLHQSLDNCPDNWGNLMNAIFDIYALAQCDYLVRREESSFSKLSECIGVFESDKVKLISPEKALREKISLIKSMTINYSREVKTILIK